MSLIEFAENELDLLLENCDNESIDIQKMVNQDILDIVTLFSKQNHSGFSAKYSLNILKRLLDYKPLSPITENDEWVDIGSSDKLKYQAKRCPFIFKDDDGKVYNIEGKIFSDDGGETWYSCGDSVIEIELPYIVPDSPECVYVNKDRKED